MTRKQTHLILLATSALSARLETDNLSSSLLCLALKAKATETEKRRKKCLRILAPVLSITDLITHTTLHVHSLIIAASSLYPQIALASPILQNPTFLRFLCFYQEESVKGCLLLSMLSRKLLWHMTPLSLCLSLFLSKSPSVTDM